jgi:hypothetical protein
VSAITGPAALARTSAAPKLPNGASTLPVHFDNDGRLLAMLITPPSALRP